MSTKLIKRRDLTLKEKVDIIRASEGQSLRQLAQKFGISKSQVGSVLKRKAELIDDYEKSTDPGAKRRCLSTISSKLDDQVFAWFSRLRSFNIPVSGPMLCAKAIDVGKKLGMESFKGSTGWLKRFKVRHSIEKFRLSGEEGFLSEGAVEEWLERMSTIIQGYAPRDIFSVDESGLFWRALPDKTLAVNGTDIYGPRKATESITAMFCVNMVGDFEKTLVVGNVERPKCFRNIDMKSLPVTWKVNKHTWMVASIFEEWIHSFNRKMKAEGRNVLLFMDNAPSHPHGIKLSNVKVIFLPTTATSILQPLHQGIILTIKLQYKQRLLEYVLDNIDATNDPNTVIAKIDMHLVVHWLSESVKTVKASTVEGCFMRAAIKPFTEEIATEMEQHNDIPLMDIFNRFQGSLQLTQPMTLVEYTYLEDDLPAHSLNDEVWENEEVAVKEEEVKEDDLVEEQVKTTDKEIHDMLDIIRLHYLQKGDSHCLDLLMPLLQAHSSRMMTK